MSAGVDEQARSRSEESHPWRAVVRSERIAELEGRIARGERPEAVAAELWEGVEATPLWEPDPDLPGAWRATFLWRGAPEQTRHVTLCGPIVFSELSGCALRHVAGTDVWHLTLRLPPGTRSAYLLAPNGPRVDGFTLDEYVRMAAAWVHDPLNPRAFEVPLNSLVPELTPVTYSLAEAPDAPPLHWSRPQPGVAHGELEQHAFASAALGNTRRVWTYASPGWVPDGPERPLLVAFDGWDAVHVTQLPVVLDNLVAAGAIPPVAAVLVDSGTPEMRMRELDCHAPFLTFLTDELLPWARERWDLDPDRSRTLVAGISLGGRAALFAGLRRPDVFGKVIAQSAAVTETDPPELLAFPAASGDDALELYLDVGLLELDPRGERSFLAGVRRVRAALSDAGHRVHHAELACGHDDIVDGETIADGLRLLLAADG